MKNGREPYDSGKLAFDNVCGDLFYLSEEMIARGNKASRESRRKRMILPVHREQSAEVQRMINFMQPGTYIRPHMHPLPHASESLMILSGSIRFYTFDAAGNIQSVQVLRSAAVPSVLDIEPGVWHSFIVLEEDTMLFETKKGPYDTEKDKVFAEWAPEEGTRESGDWLRMFTNDA